MSVLVLVPRLRSWSSVRQQLHSKPQRPLTHKACRPSSWSDLSRIISNASVNKAESRGREAAEQIAQRAVADSQTSMQVPTLTEMC